MKGQTLTKQKSLAYVKEAFCEEDLKIDIDQAKAFKMKQLKQQEMNEKAREDIQITDEVRKIVQLASDRVNMQAAHEGTPDFF